MREIRIHTTGIEKVGFVLENNEVAEYIVERPGTKQRTGSVFVGKVSSIDKGLQAAFIDIGEEKHAFLRNDSIPWKSSKIEQTIHEGERIFVQIIKEGIQEKAPQLTADITIPGLYAVFQPFGRKVSISKKIPEDQKGSLKEQVSNELIQQEGCIIRTASAKVDIEIVLEEILLLKKFWKEICNDRLPLQKPGLVWQDFILPDQLLRKFPIHTIDQVIVDDVTVSKLVKSKYPSLAAKIKWKRYPALLNSKTLNEWQDQLTRSVVELEDGIQLFIEATEAMTVIDVNSHRYKGKAMTNSQAMDINKQAALEVSKQIRLRNISGIIMIDFISMKEYKDKKTLADLMKKLVTNDPVKTNIFGMTRLGIMEITRKREWPSLLSYCTVRKAATYTLETEVFRLERELLSRKQTKVEAILIVVHPSIIHAKKQLISEQFSSKIPQELFVREDETIQSYQIELEGSEEMVREAVDLRGYHVDNLF